MFTIVEVSLFTLLESLRRQVRSLYLREFPSFYQEYALDNQIIFPTNFVSMHLPCLLTAWRQPVCCSEAYLLATVLSDFLKLAL